MGPLKDEIKHTLNYEQQMGSDRNAANIHRYVVPEAYIKLVNVMLIVHDGYLLSMRAWWLHYSASLH